MGDDDGTSRRDRWARFRFSVIGGLLASPPARGELGPSLAQLARRRYQHPIHGGSITVGTSTIERWYYQARDQVDPVAALRRRVRSDAGQTRVMSVALLAELERQVRSHPSWSYQLHIDNLAALVSERPMLGPMPSGTTVRRRMHARGWAPRRPKGPKGSAGRQRAQERLERREVRSYEAEHVHALWHLDFHEGRRHVVDERGTWHKPVVLGILDDRTRLACHVQWYLRETAEVLIHGLLQAFQKRGLPRALMTDNGAAMLARETEAGLGRLGITHETTLPYSPYQNAKQESFWGPLEGRLMAMLEDVEPLSLSYLNRATQAWVEMEHNRESHDDVGIPIERVLEGPDVSRAAPDGEVLRQAFTARVTRIQRRSDGTISLDGVRFEIPARMRHVRKLVLRHRSWDHSVAYVVDPRTDAVLARIHPLDKARHASGQRRALAPVSTAPDEPARPREPSDPVPPLLRRLIAEYAATGLPAAYLPLPQHTASTPDDEESPDE